ncbi:TPA: DNA-binding transcriptional regulator [Klebsiella pneumoniae subsp. pneumoniae]|nr:DNA-binding transcriptional regulator [Klebsiella pneumoniae]HDS4308921.1 DNA-binding transcriptional regulator [Klebsiella pneumoniae subsp. pneumoniae]
MPENTPPSESPDRQDERYDRQMFRILRNIDLNLLTIFEAVYVHKGIVNAAKILNITPSAISQSINKLRALFPDPLFIRKGQGVTPTAYATHLHQYISRGMEAFLSALDITSSPHQQRVITIATTPAMGALLMPGLASALKPTFPQILLHNIAIVDAARQLDQRQVDLLIDTHLHSGQAISHHVLYQDRVQMYCRAGHPALDGPQDETTLAEYEFALLLPEGQRYPTLHRRLQEEMGERRCGFSTFNLMTQAAMIAGSDMLGLTTERLFAMVSRLWPLQTLDFPSLGEEQIDVALHFNKLSGKEPLLKEIIETVIRSFKA